MVEIINSGVTENGTPFVTVGGVGNYSVRKTFDCGQCFRFDEVPSEHECEVRGVAYGKHLTIIQDVPGEFTIIGSDSADFDDIWRRYLALDTDYDEIDSSIISAFPEGSPERAHMTAARDTSLGIRILRQDPWETLCSFIVSQNNNIPRIKKIIRAMSEAYGERIDGTEEYSFPTAEALAEAGVDAIFALRTGFRAKYIHDCAVKCASGTLDYDHIIACEDYNESATALEAVNGVGPKVAACALLFGFGKTEAFPIDVWIKRVIANRFPSGLDPKVFGKYAGIAQQYLFYYERVLASKY